MIYFLKFYNTFFYKIWVNNIQPPSRTRSATNQKNGKDKFKLFYYYNFIIKQIALLIKPSPLCIKDCHIRPTICLSC